MTSLNLIADETQAAVLETDEQSARRIGDLLAESFAPDEIAVSLVDTGQGAPTECGRWRVTIFFRGDPDEAALRELTVIAAGSDAAKALRFETVAAKDWVRESLAGLKPVTAGRFIIHGGHDRDAVPSNRIGIEIEAALAFGTGHHGTTRGCLVALDHICRSGALPRRILDVGTGTGVLAIAAAHALRRRRHCYRYRYRCGAGRTRQCPPQSRRRHRCSCMRTASWRRQFMPAPRSISCSPISCSARSSGSRRRSGAFSRPAAVSFCPAS